MRVCEVCGKEFSAGHIVYPDTAHTFYLCIECFEKFYGKDLEDYMYENDLQYYTEWEEEDEEL